MSQWTKLEENLMLGRAARKDPYWDDAKARRQTRRNYEAARRRMDMAEGRKILDRNPALAQLLDSLG